ncbi:MAG: hypothetical protein KKD29_05935 [Candidatus Omnitrophica bacterium]|nr:hypothetical protein [Candidatus Omnitrophota bacterium]MBU4488878.1 hypothetical protein [Candidatus Omnitrophota bacterium]MCG2705466.1 hypothetical protein [Candidatus Omnitrophota bacterium]
MKRFFGIIAASFIALGVASISAQIILLRELLSAFYGNELSIGIILASWLLLVSAGSFLSGKVSDKIINKLEVFAAMLILLALAIPATLFLARTMKHIMALMPGEIIGFGPAFYLSLAALSLFCLPYGFLFPLGAKIISRFHSDKAKSTVSAYFFEAAGTVIGGTLVSLILIKILTPFNIAFALSFFILITAILLLRYATNKKVFILRYIAVFLLALNMASWPLEVPRRIERLSRLIMWRPFNLIKTENSIYGNVTAVSERGQFSFYVSGGFTFTSPDARGAEETVHYPLAIHPNPRNILLVGGGLNGTLGELYKYDLDLVDYVELDPVLIKVAKNAIGKRLQEELSNPILKIHWGDGRSYIKTTHKKYDIIILAVPAPHTIQVNRFYTKEFFTEAKNILKENGILSLGCEGGENYIGTELAEYLGTIYRTLVVAGFEVKIIPGENMKFIAFRGSAANVDAKSLQEALDARKIKTTFVRDYYLENRLIPERVEYAERTIRGAKKLRINTDFKPVSYYYDMTLWATSFQPTFNALLKVLNEKILWYFIFLAYFVVILLGIKKEKTAHRPIIIAVVTTGFAEMAIELSIMLAFQALYGYLYYKLGLIVTLFMAGLGAGSFITSKRMDYIKNSSLSLKKSKIALSLFSFSLIPIFKTLSNYTHFYWANAGALFIFPALVFITGILGGAQFALASKIITKGGSDVGKTSGVLYGADLAGGVAGALLLAAIFVPILGILQCLIAVGILNLVSALIIRNDAA